MYRRTSILVNSEDKKFKQRYFDFDVKHQDLASIEIILSCIRTDFLIIFSPLIILLFSYCIYD